MTSTDLKGHLLARRANLAAAEQQRVVQVLLAEDQLREARGQLGAVRGAIAEIDRTLPLIEPAESPPPPAS